MKSNLRIFLAAVVLVSSLTCKTLMGNPAVQLDTESLARGEEQLQKLIENDIFMGDLVELDKNQDGKPDQAIYHYPQQEIETDVFLETSLVYTSAELDENPTPNAYRKELWLLLNNQSPQEKRVQFTFEIPKEFAQSVDQLVFNPEPAEIINPDPVVKYDVNTPSYQPGGETIVYISGYLIYLTSSAVTDFKEIKYRLRQEAFNQMKEKCKSAPVDERNACYLSLVTDFKDMLDKKWMENICSGEMTGLERRICLSLAKDSAVECDRASTPEDIMACKGYYVHQKCKGLDGGELQACLRDTSMANKAPLGCMNLEDPDVRNECYATASGDASFCARITNQARREGCEKALNAGGGPADQSQPGPVSVDPSRWFNADSAEGDCKPFAALFPDYTLTHTDGDYVDESAKLICDMDANDPDLDDILYEVAIWIWAYDSSETARQVWETDVLDGYTYASRKNQQETNPDPNFTLTLELDRYFGFSKTEHYDKPPSYSIMAGAIYKNARIAFLFESYSGTPSIWVQVEALFQQLIDRKSR